MSRTQVPSNGPRLASQTVLVIGGSAGIGLETARLARAEGADVILTARDPEGVHQAGLALGASIAAFDPTDFDRLARFFAGIPGPVDHVLVACPRPSEALLPVIDLDEARHDVDAQLFLPVQVARHAIGTVPPGGSLLFTGAADDRRAAPGLGIASALAAALPALIGTLALELAPIRVNLIAAGTVDAPPADVVAERVNGRREQLGTTLPIGRAVAPADVAALAIHLMTDSAVTGATFDIDGGRQLVAR